MHPSVRSFLKAWMPPIVSDWRHRKVWRAYSSFDAAQQDSLTYQEADVVEVVAQKTQRFVANMEDCGRVIQDRQTLQNLFVFEQLPSPVNVLELGGACGATFFTAAHFLPQRLERWLIVETPAMARAGADLCADARLAFHTNLTAAARALRHRDLLMAQGVLQYLPDPVQAWHQLFQLDFDFVYVTRTAVGVDLAQAIVTQQPTRLSEHGPGILPPQFRDRPISIPLTIVPESSFKIPPSYRAMFSFAESPAEDYRIGARRVALKTIGVLAQKVAQ